MLEEPHRSRLICLMGCLKSPRQARRRRTPPAARWQDVKIAGIFMTTFCEVIDIGRSALDIQQFFVLLLAGDGRRPRQDGKM
jgi:hypothetical protein